MSRPTVEVADLLHTHGDRFVAENRSWLSYQQLKVLRAIQRCRTPALGGHLDHCSGCGHSAISFNSCRNRHCPKCQAQARQRWLACREHELLGLSYFHVVSVQLVRQGEPLSTQSCPAVQLAISFRSRNTAGSRGRSAAPWCRDRVPSHPAQLGPEPAAPSTHPLPRSSRRPFTRSQRLDSTEVSLFSSARCSQEGLSRQVSRGTQACLSQEQAQSRRRDRAAQGPQGIPDPTAISASEKLGCLCQAGHGWA